MVRWGAGSIWTVEECTVLGSSSGTLRSKQNSGIGLWRVQRWTWSSPGSSLSGWKRASNCQHVQDSHCCRKKLQSNPQGSAVHHIWPEEVLPVPLRTPFILVTDHKPLTALFRPKKGTPFLTANRLARWALWQNQFDYTTEYRKTADHSNADALSRLPSGDDINFNREESGEDMDMVCSIKVLSLQIQPVDASILRQESQKDPMISTVMRYVWEGWPSKNIETNDKVNKFRKLSDSLSTCYRCLIHGSRVVIPQSLQSKALGLLHLGHFGMEWMKQLARTAVYWPSIDAAIEMASRRCDSCGEHQNNPSKPPVHPWTLPEKP